MAKNVQLQNVNEVNVYPKTFAKNVYFNDGKTLEDKIFDLLHGENIIFEPYQLPDATRFTKGGVIVGNGLNIENGVLSVNKDSPQGITYYKQTFNKLTGGVIKSYSKN